MILSIIYTITDNHVIYIYTSTNTRVYLQLYVFKSCLVFYNHLLVNKYDYVIIYLGSIRPTLLRLLIYHNYNIYMSINTSLSLRRI